MLWFSHIISRTPQHSTAQLATARPHHGHITTHVRMAGLGERAPRFPGVMPIALGRRYMAQVSRGGMAKLCVASTVLMYDRYPAHRARRPTRPTYIYPAAHPPTVY